MSAPELAPGQIIAGKYAIQSLLGHGGTTATYQAITAPNRQVALKLYDRALTSFPDVLKMLGRYQMTTTALASRSIAPIVESGNDPESGAPYTVTDFEANPTLADLVDVCPLSVSEMVSMIRNLTRALDLLHEHGILHLAIHPRNLFVGPAPGYEVKVADFGAGAVRQVLPAPESLSRRAPWLAPEQTSETHHVDARADVFATALVAFFAIAGQSYWRSCPKGAVDIAAWQREIGAPRVPASERANELLVSLSPAFDAVFARALAASPAERYRSVGEFADALARANGSPAGVVDIPPPPPQVEAVLSAFETNTPLQISPGQRRPEGHAERPGLAPTDETLTERMDFAQANDLTDSLPPSPARGGGRRRIFYVAGAAALLLGLGGGFAVFSRPKRPSTPATEPAKAAWAAPSATAGEPTPAAIASAQSPPTEAPVAAPEALLPTPATESQAVPSAAPTTSARVPVPVVRRPTPAPRPPAATTPRPAPAKKPCGKFLKRCT